MKLSILRLFTVVAVMLGMTLAAQATIIPFAHAQGYGLQTQESYHESYPISGSLSYPVTSWYQWETPMGWNYSITADTDVAADYYTVGQTSTSVPVQVWIF